MFGIVVRCAKAPILSVLHWSADRCRDRGKWGAAVRLYDGVLALLPGYDGVRIQAAMCEDRLGLSRKALSRFSQVRIPAETKEAVNQAGLLLQRKANFAAAMSAFEWCYAAGHRDALRNLAGERLRIPDLHISPLINDDDRLEILLAHAEAHPLDIDTLSRSAIAASAYQLPAYAKAFAKLALLLAGTSAERSALIHDLAEKLDIAEFKQQDAGGKAALRTQMSAQDAERAFMAALAANPADDQLPVQAGSPSDVPASFFDSVIQYDKDHGALVPDILAAVEALTQAVFFKAGPIAGAAKKLADASDRLQGKTVISVRDFREPVDPRGLVDRVLLNVSRKISERLLQTAELAKQNEALIAALFAIPSRHANAALAPSGDDALLPLAFRAGKEETDEQKLRMSTRALAFLAPLLADQEVLQLAATAPSEFRAHLKRELLRRPWLSFSNGTPSTLALKEAQVDQLLGDKKAALRGLLAYIQQQPNDTVAPRALLDLMVETMDADEIGEILRAHPTVAKAASRYNFFQKNSQGSSDAPAPVRGAVLANAKLFFGPERIELIDAGWLKEVRDGMEFSCFSSVSAIRAKVYSPRQVVGMEVRLDDNLADQMVPSRAATDSQGVHQYFCNAWIDVSKLVDGFVNVSLSVDFDEGAPLRISWICYVNNSAGVAALDASDAMVPLAAPGDNRTAFERVAALPSVFRPAKRSAFVGPFHRIAVMRLDQLGDLSTSLPAVLRLKELFPSSEFVAIVSPANKPFIETLGVFTEVLGIPFPYDHAVRTRSMSLPDQAKLRTYFADKPVDIAIDLSSAHESRRLLKLLNARYLVGFNPREFAFLDYAFEASTRDPVNRREKSFHGTMTKNLVESLGVIVAPQPPRIPPRLSLLPILDSYGLRKGEYIVIHSGSRLAIKRWALENYMEVVAACRKEYGLPIVFFSDEPLPPAMSAHLEQVGGVQVIQGLASFDQLDALLSFAALVMGNDTGPKHVAALRGVKTISVHMCQVNWNEWGQDGDGLIITRRTPCGGCGIQDPSECGRDLICLTSITPSDVMNCMSRLLKGAETALA